MGLRYDTAPLQVAVDAVLILAQGLALKSSSTHHILLPVVCGKLILIGHELTTSIVLHTRVRPIDLHSLGSSSCLASVVTFAMAALPVVRRLGVLTFFVKRTAESILVV
jgi:hypothetical protein